MIHWALTEEGKRLQLVGEGILRAAWMAPKSDSRITATADAARWKEQACMQADRPRLHVTTGQALYERLFPAINDWNKWASYIALAREDGTPDAAFFCHLFVIPTLRVGRATENIIRQALQTPTPTQTPRVLFYSRSSGTMIEVKDIQARRLILPCSPTADVPNDIDWS